MVRRASGRDYKRNKHTGGGGRATDGPTVAHDDGDNEAWIRFVEPDRKSDGEDAEDGLEPAPPPQHSRKTLPILVEGDSDPMMSFYST